MLGLGAVRSILKMMVDGSEKSRKEKITVRIQDEFAYRNTGNCHTTYLHTAKADVSVVGKIL